MLFTLRKILLIRLGLDRVKISQRVSFFPLLQARHPELSVSKGRSSFSSPCHF